MGWHEKESKAETQVHGALKDAYYDAYHAAKHVLVGKSRLLSRKLGYYQAKLHTIKQKSILAGKTHIQTRKLTVLSRKPAGSFRDSM